MSEHTFLHLGGIRDVETFRRRLRELQISIPAGLFWELLVGKSLEQKSRRQSYDLALRCQLCWRMFPSIGKRFVLLCRHHLSSQACRGNRLCQLAPSEQPKRFFISFSPGFNQVSSFGSEFPEPFQRFPAQPKTQQNIRT